MVGGRAHQSGLTVRNLSQGQTRCGDPLVESPPVNDPGVVVPGGRGGAGRRGGERSGAELRSAGGLEKPQ